MTPPLVSVVPPFLPIGIPITQNTFCNLNPNALSDINDRCMPRTCFMFETENGEKDRRCFHTFIPDCAGENSPLVFDIHGATSCPLWSSLYTGWWQLAEENCFVVAWPYGETRRSQSSYSCFEVPGGLTGFEPFPDYETADCCCSSSNGDAADLNRNDPEFIRTIVSHVVRDVPVSTEGRVSIDTKRIYMSGHSNGCMLSYAVTMKYPELVAAVACFAGSLLTPPVETYQPTPIWFVHGTEDDVLGYYGNSSDPEFYLASQQDIYENLHVLNGCNETENTTLSEDTGDDGFYQKSSGCTNNATVEFLTLQGVGHTPYSGAVFVEENTPNYDTTSDAWSFVSRFQLDVEPELVDVRDDHIMTNIFSGHSDTNRVSMLYKEILSLIQHNRFVK